MRDGLVKHRERLRDELAQAEGDIHDLKKTIAKRSLGVKYAFKDKTDIIQSEYTEDGKHILI